jgi:hypothetical protein
MLEQIDVSEGAEEIIEFPARDHQQPDAAIAGAV